MTTAVRDKLLAEIKRLAKSRDPQVRQFVAAMLARHPELRG